MPEISGFANARTRLNTLYDFSALPAHIVDDYARIAAFLSDAGRFESALESVSERLWGAYRRLGPDTRNRFTRALAEMSTTYGFMLDPSKQCVTNLVVLVGAVDGAQYLEWVKAGLFFKDDMDLKHGEHSHTLQWLAISVARKDIGLSIAENPAFLYRSIYEVKPKAQSIAVPGFKLATKGKDPGRRNGVSLWSWLLDCFPVGMAEGQVLPQGESLFTESYRCPQVLMRYLMDRAGEDHFIGTYLRYRYRRRRWLPNATSGYDAIAGGATSKNHMRNKLKSDERWKAVGPENDPSAFIKVEQKREKRTGEDTRHWQEVVLHGQAGELRDPDRDWC